MKKTSNAAKSAMASKAKGAFERVIIASEFESSRNKAAEDPNIHNLGFGVRILSVISHIERNSRHDFALSDGTSLSLLYGKQQVLIESDQVGHTMKLSPETPTGYDTKRGEYSILESKRIPDFAILRDKILVGIVQKTYINNYGDLREISPENATLLAAALSNSQEIYNFRSDVDMAKAFLDGCASPNENMFMMEQILGINLAGLSYFGRLAYWIGRTLFDMKDVDNFTRGHIALVAETDKPLYGSYFSPTSIIIPNADRNGSVTITWSGASLYEQSHYYTYKDDSLDVAQDNIPAGITIYDLINRTQHELGSSERVSLIGYPRNILGHINDRFLEKLGAIIRTKDWI